MRTRPDRESRVIILRVPDWPDAWAGWRFRGGLLLSPDGHRITPERLRGLLFRQDSERRLAAARAREQRSAGMHEGLRDRVRRLVTAGTND